MAPKIKKKQSLLRVLVQWTVFSASLLIVDSGQQNIGESPVVESLQCCKAQTCCNGMMVRMWH